MNHRQKVKKTCVVNFESDKKNTQANIQTLTENVNFVSRHNVSVKRQSSIILRSLQVAWADIQATCATNAKQTITEQLNYVGYYTGTVSSHYVDFSGTTLASDGRLYITPFSANDLPIFNPTTLQYTSAGTPGTGAAGTSGKFGSSVYAPSTNAVYYFSYYYGKVLKYSLDSQMLTPLEDITGTWNYGTLAPNNCVYAVSHLEQSQIIKLDLATETFTYLTVPFGNFSSYGFRCAPNGRLYAAPSDGTYVLCLDPATDQMTRFGSLPTGSRKWLKGILAPNGYIYAMPCNSTKILKIDYISQQAALLPNITLSSFTFKYNVAGLAPNGKIYAVPGILDNIAVFNPTTEQISYIPETITTNRYNGYCVGFDGCLYVTPRIATRTIIKIDAGANVCQNFSQDTLLSPLLN